MAHLIDKDTLVAEIKKLRKKNDVYDKPSHIADVCCEEILSLIDTLEVKEVDIEKEIEFEYNPIDGLSFEEFERIAKYFFEFGLKAQKGEDV